jgi:hypothetical protein
MKTLTDKLLEFQKQIQVIKKDAKNPHFKNTYATLKQVLSEVKPILSEVGLLITQPIDERGIGTVITDGKDSISSFIPIPLGLAPQPLGSAISYFRRYTLCSLLALEIDDDDAHMTTASKPIATKENIDKAKKGNFTLAQIKQHYTITKEMEAYYESI